MKKLLFLLLLVGVAFVVGAAYYANPRSSDPENGYRFDEVKWGTIQETVNANGPLQPRQVAAVSGPLSGQVVKIYPGSDINQPVKEGQELLELDLGAIQPNIKLKQALAAQKAAQATVKRAEAAKKAAEKALEIQKDLQEKGGYTKDVEKAKFDLDTANAAVDAAQSDLDRANAAVEEAQEGVKKTTVRAPISGVIIKKDVVLGQSISPLSTTPLFLIASDLQKMKIHAQVAQSDVKPELRRTGLKATITVDGSSREEDQYQGRVAEIWPVPNNILGNSFYTLVIEVENPKDKSSGQWRFLPGMIASVDIVVLEHSNVWKVPNSALSLDLDEHHQTPAAKEHLASLQAKPDKDDWRAVWILGPDRKPWPIFVKVGGKNAAGEIGVQDNQYVEGLSWDTAPLPTPDPKAPETYPRLIIGAPPASKQGFLDQKVRLF
ncbi:MAG TPA: efflux RND transporter periplasmic adaptor subunit [Gemmataceae bacterium]|nr:efflux RND transporter periplasmic adaptor subunit [Gemmataceae bacterium]